MILGVFSTEARTSSHICRYGGCVTSSSGTPSTLLPCQSYLPISFKSTTEHYNSFCIPRLRSYSIIFLKLVSARDLSSVCFSEELGRPKIGVHIALLTVVAELGCEVRIFIDIGIAFCRRTVGFSMKGSSLGTLVEIDVLTLFEAVSEERR